MPADCGYFDGFYGWIACAPPPKPPSFRPGEPEVARVESGDTLGAIAAANGVSIADLLEANPQIDNPNMISIGEAILIPSNRTPTVPDPATGLPVSAATSPGYEADDSGTVGDDVAGAPVSATTTPGYEADDSGTVGDDLAGAPVSATTSPVYVGIDKNDGAGTMGDDLAGDVVSTINSSPGVIGGSNGVTIVNDPAGGPPIVIPNGPPQVNGGGNGGNVAEPQPLPPSVVHNDQLFGPVENIDHLDPLFGAVAPPPLPSTPPPAGPNEPLDGQSSDAPFNTMPFRLPPGSTPVAPFGSPSDPVAFDPANVIPVPTGPTPAGEGFDGSSPFDDLGSKAYDALEGIFEKRVASDVLKGALGVGGLGRFNLVVLAFLLGTEPGTVYAPGLDYEPTLENTPPTYSTEQIGNAIEYLREEGYSDRVILEAFSEAQIIEGPRRR